MADKAGNASEITIIMPTYNRRKYLPTALKCFVDQTFRSWHLLVVNDGGEDVADLIAAVGDARIEYLNRPHEGKAAQLNFAIAHSQSKYIAYMDDDDVVYPEHLQSLYDAAERLQSDFVYSDTWQLVVDADGNCSSKTVENTADVLPADIRLYNRINHKQILHTRELSDRVGSYDEKLRILIDFDYIKRLVMASRNPFHLRKITGEHYLRISSGQNAAITGLWQRDPVAAGRSLLAIFEKDPAALAELYRLPGKYETDNLYLQARLDDRLSAKWRKWKHRNDKVAMIPHDDLPPKVDWTDCTPKGGEMFCMADETHDILAAVNRIASGSAGEQDFGLMNCELTSPIQSAKPQFSATTTPNGLHLVYPEGKEKRWVTLCSQVKLPQDFALSFTYTPHGEFKEQLQIDFAMNSLGDRTRFMLRENRRLVFSRVSHGRFLPDDRTIPLQLKLGEPVRIRMASVQGVHSFSVNGRTFISLRTDATPSGYLALIFYQDAAEGTIDLEIGDIRLERLS